MSLPPELVTPLFSQIWHLRQHQPRISQVERLATTPNAQEFTARIQPAGYPVIWHDPALEICPAAEVLDRLVQSAADEILKVRRANYDAAADYVHSRQYSEISLGEYVAQLRKECHSQAAPGPKTRYAGNQQLPSHLAASLGVRAPACLERAQFEPPAFWLGPAGSVTPLHKDSTDNFAFQVLGAKQWLLFPVRDAGMLSLTRPDQAASSDFATSSLDLEHQFASLPVYPIEVTLERGEVLYLPAGWSHAVKNLTLSLMVNYWISKAAFGEIIVSPSFLDNLPLSTRSPD